MGVLNITPDSFSDGGDFLAPEKALARALEMMEEGADFLDIGAESSAPDSVDVPLEAEWSRLEAILPELKKRKIPFSVDTWKAETARRALENGAAMINDVTGLRGDPEMISVLRNSPESFICVMYSKDSSARTTRTDLQEDDIVQKISSFFQERLDFLQKNGLEPDRVILDPGMGTFLSSDPMKSFEVLRRLLEFQRFGWPLLVGTSRKGFLKTVSPGEKPKDRMVASIVSSLAAIQNGARIVRVHDVRAMREAFTTWQQVSSS